MTDYWQWVLNGSPVPRDRWGAGIDGPLAGLEIKEISKKLLLGAVVVSKVRSVAQVLLVLSFGNARGHDSPLHWRGGDLPQIKIAM